MFFDLAHLWPYFLVVISMVVSPGADSVLIVRNTLGSGSLVGLAAVAGVQAGIAMHTILAITGISLIIRSSALLFSVLTIVGAVYLCWLGAQALFRRGGLITVEGKKSSVWRSFRDALVTNALNPKAVVLFLSVMPGFVLTASDAAYNTQLISLACILLTLNTIWQVILVYSADFLGKQMSSEHFVFWVNRISGAFLLCFGILLLFENFHAF